MSVLDLKIKIAEKLGLSLG